MSAKVLARLFSYEILVVVLGLFFGVIVARYFGVEAKGQLAQFSAIIGLAIVSSSLGVSYSAVKLKGFNTNRLFLIFSIFGSLVSLIFILIYQRYGDNVIHTSSADLVLILFILFFSIYNLQSLALILSSSIRGYYPAAIISGQVGSITVLMILIYINQFNVIWLVLISSFAQFIVSFYGIKYIGVVGKVNRSMRFFEYIKISIHQAPIIYLTSILIHIPVILISTVSLKEAGIFSVAFSSVMIIGKIPRLIHGMTIGGTAFNRKKDLSDIIKLHAVTVITIISFHLIAHFLITGIYGDLFLDSVNVAIILAYSMLPLLYVALVEAKLLVEKKYNQMIYYKIAALVLFFIFLMIGYYYVGFISAITVAWAILGYRFISIPILYLLIIKKQSIRLFS
jgi:O-antigen/teichoic acid export membrane protein